MTCGACRKCKCAIDYEADQYKWLESDPTSSFWLWVGIKNYPRF